MNPLVIAHKLVKLAGAIDNAELQQRDDIYDESDTAVQRLITGAKRGVTRSSSIGCFEREEDETPKILERLLNTFNEAPNTDSFVTFSKAAVGALKSRMEKKAPATGGYVIFVYYENETGEQAGQKYIVIALVTDQNIPSFDENLDLIDSTVLDLENLKHGARIRMSNLADNSDGVISLLPSKRASETAGYFSDFIGCRNFTNSHEMAVKLDERLEEWCESQQMTADEASEFRFDIFKHWKKHRGSSEGISIESLGNTVYADDDDNRDEFVTFMTDEENGVPGQTPAIAAKHMNRFKKFIYSSEGLKLEFDTGGRFSWRSRIKAENGRIIIDDAPDDLIAQINQDQNDES